MIEKEVKSYKRKNTKEDSYLYRININKKDNLNDKVAILNLDEYNGLNTEIQKLNKQLQDQTKIIDKKDLEITELKNKIIDLEQNIKNIHELEEIHKETIKEINNLNNENIAIINNEHTKIVAKYESLNQILINGLKNIKNTGFMDRLTNKNKPVITKLLKENIKQLPSNPEYEMKEKE